MRRFLPLTGAALAAALGILAVLALTGVLGDGDDPADDSPVLPGVATGQDPGQQVNDIYRRSRGAVVFIQAAVSGEGRSPFGPDRGGGGVATGSGWLFDDDGHIVTNAHVVENARKVAIKASEDSLIDAQVVGTDLSTDLAVLRVDPDELDARALPLGDSITIKVGDPVVTMGNPLGLEDTVTTGIVSARQREIRAPNGFAIQDAIQSDAAINPGNSGGPLLDFEGRVIGVNSQIATAGSGSQGFIGIGFAVPTSTVRDIVPELIESGKIRRPFVGVTTASLNASIARRLGLDTDSGALVVSVADSSPADRAGIRGSRGAPLGAIQGGGDVIVAIEGQPVENSEDVAERVQQADIGDRIEVALLRGGRRVTTTVRVAERPG